MMGGAVAASVACGAISGLYSLLVTVCKLVCKLLNKLLKQLNDWLLKTAAKLAVPVRHFLGQSLRPGYRAQRWVAPGSPAGCEDRHVARPLPLIVAAAAGGR